MDNQPIPSQAPQPGERPGGYRPEDLQVSGPELPAQTEMAPAAGATSPPQAPRSSQSPKMSRDDVVAAIAAVPGPAAPTVGAPTSADDVDVIEPAWVDAAEHVVAQHQGDPYGEEEAIEDLNRDYLSKRYGYTVADPDDGSKGSK